LKQLVSLLRVLLPEQFVLFFDVFLLIMRDADLWYDFAAWVREHSGRVGTLILLFGTHMHITYYTPSIFWSFVDVICYISIRPGQLVAGDSDEIGDSIYSVGKSQVASKFQPPSRLEEARVKRELTESEYRDWKILSSIL
jgi:hypothetical protein